MAKKKSEVVETKEMIRKENVQICTEISSIKYLRYHTPSSIMPIVDNLFGLKDSVLITDNVIKIRDNMDRVFYMGYYSKQIPGIGSASGVPNALIIIKGELDMFSRHQTLIITETSPVYESDRTLSKDYNKDIETFNHFKDLKKLIKSFQTYKTDTKRSDTLVSIVSKLTDVINTRWKGPYNYSTKDHACIKFNYGHFSCGELMLTPVHRDDLELYEPLEFVPVVTTSKGVIGKTSANNVWFPNDIVEFDCGVSIDAKDEGEDLLKIKERYIPLRIDPSINVDLDSTRGKFLSTIFRTNNYTGPDYDHKLLANRLNLTKAMINGKQASRICNFEGEFFGREYTKEVSLSLRTFIGNTMFMRGRDTRNGWFLVLDIKMRYKDSGLKEGVASERTTYILPICGISIYLLGSGRGLTMENLIDHIVTVETETIMLDRPFEAIGRISETNRVDGRNGYRNGMRYIDVLGTNGIKEFISELKKYYSKEERI